jgi:hypothetical protein
MKVGVVTTLHGITEVGRRTTLHSGHPALGTAARWLRKELGIPNEKTILNEFEKYFNCKAMDAGDFWVGRILIKFKSEQDLIIFLLRWA